LTWPPALRRQPSPKRRARPGSCASRRHRDGPDGGGVDTDQRQVPLTPLRGFRNQALQQGLEHAGVAPLPETIGHRRPGTEFLRHLPPLPAGPEPPDHALELLAQPLGVRAILADRQVRLDELPLHIGQLRTRHARRSTGSKISTRGEPTH
jgi:hypothetical protein